MSTDFWARQEKARRRTGVLVIYFCLAVVLLITGVYFILALGPHDETGSWWHTDLLMLVSVGMIAVIGLGSFVRLSQLSAGGSVVADMLGGRLVHPESRDQNERRLMNVVQEMAIASGVSVPPVYVMDDEDGINAFAAGYAPGDAVIGVTRGCVQKLKRDELQGVIAHEFSHILNGDMRLNIKLMGIIFGIICLTVVARILMRIGFYSGGSRDRNQAGAALGVLGLALFVLGWIGVFFGNLIQAAISREREHLADSSAVQFTRNPTGLVGALKKIAGIGSQLETKRAGEASHMFFGSSLSRTWAGLFATHPPIEERIRLLDASFQKEVPESAPQASVETVAGVSGLASGSAAVKAKDVAAQAGQLSAAQINHAHQFLECLPSEITTAVHEPFGAVAAIYAMLLGDDPDLRQFQLQLLGTREHPALLAEAEKLQPIFAAQPSRAKLPLVELAMPALRQLSHAQYRDFSENLRQLAEADQKIDLFEFALARLVRRHLAPHFGDASADVPRRSAFQLMPSARIILSSLARLNPDPAAAFHQGARHLPKTTPGFDLLPENANTMVEVSRALDQLAGARPAFARSLVKACTDTISHDGVIDEHEYEILRALCDTLDCPLPPLT